MAFSLNKVMLIGNLGRDAEQRFTSNNLSVVSFSMATTRSFKKNEEWTNETTWHNIVAFGLSDFYFERLKKGAKFYVEGRISTRSYDDKEGNKKYVTEVVAEKLIPLDSRQSDSTGEPQSGYNSAPVDNASPPAGGGGDDLPF
ncbi:MAG: single-stranded DNA-binding protein [Chlorobi bacterium]|nr:single-stranded DNA-binding protein [Chlorobiota bacterium]